jgi:hypothetical protein
MHGTSTATMRAAGREPGLDRPAVPVTPLLVPSRLVSPRGEGTNLAWRPFRWRLTPHTELDRIPP